MTLRSTLPALAAGLVLAACAGFAPYSPGDVRPGMTADQVVGVMGPPAARHALAGGATRLEYPRGPQGLHTYMVDLDVAGRVTGWEQVLTEANFNAIPVGLPASELLARLGRPAVVRVVAREPGEVWAYRYDSLRYSLLCRWWQAQVDQGQVVGMAYGLDPRCADNGPRNLVH